ncbi:MAG: site-2 protease family protein, partial [Acholeplasmatales bacterium]|nr:site-2 protease family protein [Acholeplasmatales bacterium]
VNIGIMNLLPIPALDGGRILFISIEAISKKRIPRNVDNIVNNIFFILLMVLFVYITFNDVLRLF